MNGLEKSRLKTALQEGKITTNMSKKDIYINKILALLQNEPKTIKNLIKEIK